MLAFILRRLLLMIPTTLGVALVIFSIYHAAPGDPALIAVGSQADADLGAGSDTESRVDQFRREHGLDRSLAVQFLDYIGPFNLNADGHSWFSSPRSERVVEDIEVPGTGTAEVPLETVPQGRPVSIEHLFATTPEGALRARRARREDRARFPLGRRARCGASGSRRVRRAVRRRAAEDDRAGCSAASSSTASRARATSRSSSASTACCASRPATSRR